MVLSINNCKYIKNNNRTDKVAKRLSQINTTRAVALAVSVNSPGGLPVQSEIISNKILNFAKKNNLKLYTYAGDVAASGGYFILSIGDHVVSDRNSILGSIGVLMRKMTLKGILDLTSL
jgi:ClpP class serine protease